MEPLLTAAAAGPAQDLDKLEKAHRSGANWFYWIAGLSVVNTVIQMMGSDRSFIVGLGITQVVDAIAKGVAEGAGGGSIGTVLRVLGLGLDVVVVGVFVLFGWQAGKKHGWAFVVGMVLYGLDGLLFLLLQDWLSAGFHAFALFGLWSGFSALRKLRAAQVQLGIAPITPGA